MFWLVWGLQLIHSLKTYSSLLQLYEDFVKFLFGTQEELLPQCGMSYDHGTRYFSTTSPLTPV